MNDSKNFSDELQNVFKNHQEWLLIQSSGKSFALNHKEIEIEFARNKTLVSFLDDQGLQTWRVVDFQIKNDEISLNLSRSFDRERAKIRFVPRAGAQSLSDSLELARIEKAHKIAAVLKENYPEIKLVRVELRKENSRFAQIIFEDRRREQTAVLTDVSDGLTPENLISAAIMRITKLEIRKKNPIGEIWILAETKQAKNLQKLHALLRAEWRRKIFIKELLPKSAVEKLPADISNETIIQTLKTLKFTDLWSGKRKDVKTAAQVEISETAQKIIEVSPENIDRIFSKNGETLRFNGLPFARVRKTGETEKVWFGVEKSRKLLSENNLEEFGELLQNLQNFRRFDTPNKRHEFYRIAPEAWLESILRKNIKLLDANLILSPVYHQFRVERDKIDLLALRSDRRLVIIELKTAPDPEIIFQAADYWRKIERERRLGNLEKANLFNDLKIADKPVIAYLVAPTLSFHRNFDFLSQTISEQIEIHRFDLTENWREYLKITRRKKLNTNF